MEQVITPPNTLPWAWDTMEPLTGTGEMDNVLTGLLDGVGELDVLLVVGILLNGLDDLLP